MVQPFCYLAIVVVVVCGPSGQLWDIWSSKIHLTPRLKDPLLSPLPPPLLSLHISLQSTTLHESKETSLSSVQIPRLLHARSYIPGDESHGFGMGLGQTFRSTDFDIYISVTTLLARLKNTSLAFAGAWFEIMKKSGWRYFLMPTRVKGYAPRNKYEAVYWQQGRRAASSGQPGFGQSNSGGTSARKPVNNIDGGTASLSYCSP